MDRYPGSTPSPRTNTLAVVSLVSSFFVSVVGIVTGHIALHQIKRTREKGRALAISGLIIGYAELLLTLVIAGVLVAAFVHASTGGKSSGGSSAGSSAGGTTATAPTTAAVPANLNVYGGIIFGKGGALVPPTPSAKTVNFSDLPAAPTAQPTAASGLGQIGIAAAAAGKPVQVVVYIDFMCPFCQQFEQQNAAQLNAWRDAGKITVEYRPITILDHLSQGTGYSTRAVGAADCVAATSPQDYMAYVTKLYADKPAENSSGLDNATLVKMAAAVGAGDISGCVNDGRYKPFAAYATELIIGHGLTGTPAVFVNGRQWQAGTFADFATPLVNAGQ